MKPAPPARISLGPLTYYWPRAQVLDFYEQALTWPVDIVYLGETVCSRRHELRAADWILLAERFAAAGKEAVLSTAELIETDADTRAMRAIVENGRFRVEANDMGAVRVLAARAPFVAGPFLNVYNGETLAILAECGAMRWVAPVELSGAGIAAMRRTGPRAIETEILVFGRLPLAISARCFTARYHNLDKDHCEYRCIEDPEGLALATQEGEPFLVLNGVQTQSARVQNLLPWLADVLAAGVNILRISPQPRGTAEIVAAFAAAARGGIGPREVTAPFAEILTMPACDGYWHGTAGMHRMVDS